MADDPSPSPRAAVRAGGVLDLSTGPAAPPPPSAPRPPVTPDPEVRAGRTLDLSVKPPGPPSRKPIQDFGGGLVMRETVDLSSKTVPMPEPPAPLPAPPRRGAESSASAPPSTRPRRDAPRGGGRRDDPRGRGGRDDARGRDTDRDRSTGEAPASASSSLADLLDPDVLAKLRGG